MAHKFSCINSLLQDNFPSTGNVNDSSDTHGHTVLEKESSEFISIKVTLVVLFTQKTIELIYTNTQSNLILGQAT